MEILPSKSKDGELTIQSQQSNKDDWMKEGEWIKIFDLKRKQQYNGKAGVVICLFEKHVEIKLLGSNQKQKNLKVPLHNFSRLDQKYAYIKLFSCTGISFSEARTIRRTCLLQKLF